MKTSYKRARAIMTLLVIAMNIYATTAPLFWVSTWDLSDMRGTIITPAGYAFSIWSVIYLWLIAVAWALVLKKITLTPSQLAWFCVSCLANILWLVSWHSETLWASLICMLVILVSLIALNRDLIIQKTARRVQSVFLIYLGWISIASLINALTFLDYWVWFLDAMSETVWIVSLIIAWIINLAVIFHDRKIETSLVAIWALIAITVAITNPTIDYVAWSIATTLCVGIIMSIVQKKIT